MKSPRKLATIVSISFCLLCSAITYIRFTAHAHTGYDAVQIKLLPVSK
ncbi:hypothetical protein [Sapientia aquatica]|nr:hypothetical protein [Sapientia aquatica]